MLRKIKRNKWGGTTCFLTSLLAKLNNLMYNISMKKYTSNGFTLAEVLITLAIIGIVAAMTIPTLVSKYQEKVAVSKLIKAYAEISQSILRWEAENNCTDDVKTCLSAYKGTSYRIDIVADMLKYLDQEVANEWYPSWLFLNPSKPSKSYYSLNGENLSLNPQLIACNSEYYCSRLKNGVTIQGYSYGINGAGWNANFTQLAIDINGKYPPNRAGKDRFYMCIGGAGTVYVPSIAGQNIIPYVCDPGLADYLGAKNSQCVFTGKNSRNCNPDDGLSPTAYVLKHKKLPDMKALGFPENP